MKMILIIIGILIFMFSPIIFVSIYKKLMKLRGQNIHEGNSSTYASGWYSFITIPVGLIALVVYIVGKMMGYF